MHPWFKVHCSSHAKVMLCCDVSLDRDHRRRRSTSRDRDRERGGGRGREGRDRERRRERGEVFIPCSRNVHHLTDHNHTVGCTGYVGVAPKMATLFNVLVIFALHLCWLLVKSWCMHLFFQLVCSPNCHCQRLSLRWSTGKYLNPEILFPVCCFLFK